MYSIIIFLTNLAPLIMICGQEHCESVRVALKICVLIFMKIIVRYMYLYCKVLKFLKILLTCDVKSTGGMFISRL